MAPDDHQIHIKEPQKKDRNAVQTWTIPIEYNQQMHRKNNPEQKTRSDRSQCETTTIWRDNAGINC